MNVTLHSDSLGMDTVSKSPAMPFFTFLTQTRSPTYVQDFVKTKDFKKPSDRGQYNRLDSAI